MSLPIFLENINYFFVSVHSLIMYLLYEWSLEILQCWEWLFPSCCYLFECVIAFSLNTSYRTGCCIAQCAKSTLAAAFLSRRALMPWKDSRLLDKDEFNNNTLSEIIVIQQYLFYLNTKLSDVALPKMCFGVNHWACGP